MMGSQDDRQDRLFYNFRLEDHVPEDHLLRRIDALLDLSGLREHLAPYYSHTGRPSIDPELLIRMLIVGYCYGIRSERQLCEEVRLNLAYRWFCRLSIEDAVPDHSTFSKTRPHRTSEVNSTKTMIDRVEARFELKPEHLDADTAYGSAAFLGWLVEEKNILPHIPVWDHAGRKPGRFLPTDFTWDEAADCYHCPGGKELRRNRRNFKKPRSGVTKDGVIIYRASALDCRDCPLKQRCCATEPARKIKRLIHEPARELARSLYKTPGFAQSRRDRKKVEMLFGHMKWILKLTRLRLRGITGARDEFLMAATTQNLRRMAMWLNTGPPGQSLTAPA